MDGANPRANREPTPLPASGGWIGKFRRAFRGLIEGFLDRGQRPWRNSFGVHLPAAMAVLVAAWLRQLDATSVAVLILCIGLVVTTELINSSLESMARAITDQYDPQIRNALDIAAGAVLAASMTAVAVGVLLLLL